MLGHVCQFFITKRHKRLKSEFKGQMVFKFDLGLPIAYKIMYFDRNENGNKDGKILGANYGVLCYERRISL